MKYLREKSKINLCFTHHTVYSSLVIKTKKLAHFPNL